MVIGVTSLLHKLRSKAFIFRTKRQREDHLHAHQFSSYAFLRPSSGAGCLLR